MVLLGMWSWDGILFYGQDVSVVCNVCGGQWFWWECFFLPRMIVRCFKCEWLFGDLLVLFYVILFLSWCELFNVCCWLDFQLFVCKCVCSAVCCFAVWI